MTATEQLRNLLDGYCACWFPVDAKRTKWQYAGEEYVAYELDGRLLVDVPMKIMTPEEAVESTLGSDTCFVYSKLLIDGEYVSSSYYEFEMQCGEGFTWNDKEPPKYCPCCGKKVAEL